MTDFWLKSKRNFSSSRKSSSSIQNFPIQTDVHAAPFSSIYFKAVPFWNNRQLRIVYFEILNQALAPRLIGSILKKFRAFKPCFCGFLVHEMNWRNAGYLKRVFIADQYFSNQWTRSENHPSPTITVYSCKWTLKDQEIKTENLSGFPINSSPFCANPSQRVFDVIFKGTNENTFRFLIFHSEFYWFP